MKKVLTVVLLALSAALVFNSCASKEYVTKNEKLIDVKYTGEIDDSEAEFGPLIHIKNSKIGSCSAFVISNEYALTAGHCLNDEGDLITEDFKVFTASNQEAGVAKAASYNGRRDFGVLRGNFKKFKKVSVRKEAPLLMEWSGQFIGCGFVGGSVKPTCEEFKLMGINTFYLVGQMPVFPGMSGGPVVDYQTGEILGVIIAGNSGPANCIITPLIGFDADLGIELVEETK